MPEWVKFDCVTPEDIGWTFKIKEWKWLAGVKSESGPIQLDGSFRTKKAAQEAVEAYWAARSNSNVPEET